MIERPVAAAAESGPPTGEAEFMGEVARLARSAEGLFATPSELREWLGCMLRQRAAGEQARPHRRCDAVSATACALTFEGQCPLAARLGDIDGVMSRLPSERLSALLKLERDARSIWLPRRPAPAEAA